MKPNLCLYRDDVLEKFKRIDGKLKKDFYVMNFAHADVLGEIKEDDEDDPWVDPPESGEEERVPESPQDQQKLTSNNNFFREKETEVAQIDIDVAIGRFASHAMAILSRQYRTHCFSIGVFGFKARFFRWDRAGVVISRAFNHRKKPLLREFAKRYCQATDAQRGYDMSVCKASCSEEVKFKEKIRGHVKDLYAPKDEDSVEELVKKHYEEKKVFKIKIWPQQPEDLGDPRSIPEPPARKIFCLDGSDESLSFLEELGANIYERTELEDVEEARLALEKVGKVAAEERKSKCRQYAASKNFQYFLVSRPVANLISVAGRSTRGYWSVKIPDEDAGDDPNDYRICFLKDTWRVVTKDADREGDIMVELYEAGVEYVSDILCQSDVALPRDGITGQSSE